MAEKKIDGVIEAVRYTPDGKISLARGYLRRGSIWSDRVLLTRDELIEDLNRGENWTVGQRVIYMAGTFDTTLTVQVKGSGSQAVITTGQPTDDRDCLEGAPIF